MAQAKRQTKNDCINEYLYSVGWSEEDKVYVGRVAEFPSVSCHGSTPEAAFKEIRKLVGYVLDDLRESAEPIPKPFGRRTYSGKLNLRMPESLHRKLSVEAARDGVSLNQFINLKLEV